MKRLLTLVACLVVCSQAFCQNKNQFGVQGSDGQSFLYSILNDTKEDPSVELTDFAFTYYSETTSVSPTVSFNGKDYKVVSIGARAFMNSGLVSIDLPNTIKTIGESAFEECTELRSINMEGVESIDNYAFYGCTSLESVTISNPVIGGNGAFYGTNDLKTVNLTKESKSVYKDVFIYSTSLETINVEAGNENFISIDGVIYNPDTTELLWFPVGKKSLTIEKPTASLDLQNICSDINLQSIVVKEGNKNFVVVGGALYNADTTKLLCCPSIVKGAFEVCAKTDSIYPTAFVGCDSISSVKIPASVSFVAEGTFSNCANLEKIDVDANNSHYVSIDGVLLDASKTMLICCPPKKEGSFVVPETVTTICSMAFNNCSSLTNVVIPKSVTYIANQAFAFCTGLKNLELSGDLKYLGSGAFVECLSLESVVISGHIDEIDSFVFEDCISLKTVKIQGELKKLPLGMFQFCSSLESVELPESLETIGSQAFLYCQNLSEINIPSGLKTIDSYAFYNCASLKSIVLTKSISYVGPFAFYYCTNITIRCEAKNKPSGWDSSWNITECPVIWNYGQTNDIEESVIAENKVNIYATQGLVVVDNANANVFVYDITGKLVAKNVSNDQRVEMPIQRAGVYIVKVGNVSQRVVVQ